ncbi:SLAM family member 8 isoform X2 [Zootoca vivipara]|nr:SLAM family member 8 isoform X2 [Zootoca vivipara]XP_034954732.1 SLAM family member 8 isoform X2 [Zootoca vivipara]XP_034954733.1 SLAM family member 8 isoform X2 [Zootoca vivipara]
MSDNFGQRLETVDGSMLKISNLVVKDSGVYKAHVTFSTGVTETHTFGLTVYGAAHFPAQDPPNQLHRILGGSVLFRLNIPPLKRVDEVEWKFTPTGVQPLLVAEFAEGKLRRPHANDSFGPWVEMVDETTLKMKDLTVADSGVMDVRVRFASSAIVEYSFRLMVHEPVPPPQINHQVISSTANRCNMTLHCRAPGKSDLHFSWENRNPLRTSEALDWYRLTNDDKDLHLSWRPNTSDSTFTCLVSNPVDQKNISLDVFNICHDEAQDGCSCFSWVRTAMAVGLGLQVATIILLNILERKVSDQRCVGVEP